MATITELKNGKFRVQLRRKAFGYKEAYCDTREEAESWALETESAMLERHHAAPKVAVRELLFKDLCEKYFASPVFENKAETTRQREKSISKSVVRHFGRYAVPVIDGTMVQDYFDARSRERKKRSNGTVADSKVSGHTVRLERAFLSSVFKFAKRRNLAPRNIMLDSWDLPNCNKREGRISIQEQVNLFSAAREMLQNPKTNPCLLPWLHFVFETGTRPGEAAKAEISWFDFEKRKVNIPRQGQKKRNPRVVLLRKELADELKEQCARAVVAGSKYIFWSQANTPRPKDGAGKPQRRRRTREETEAREVRPYAYYHAWRRLCDKAGVPPTINPHIVRHEFISRLFEQTELNDGQIASLVGDVNVLSLEPYKHLRVEQLRDKQDAHLDELSSALAKMQELNYSQLLAALGGSKSQATQLNALHWPEVAGRAAIRKLDPDAMDDDS
jgi:integrase